MKKNWLRMIIAMLCVSLLICALGACNDSADTDKEKDSEEETDIFAIEYKGASVKLDAKADPVIKKLGEPKSKMSTGNCGGLGETVRYDYSAFIMVVVEYESGAKIDSIELKNDLVKTSKGLYLGSSEAAVIKAYGDPDVKNNSTYIYKEDGKELAITVADGSVSAIVFRCV